MSDLRNQVRKYSEETLPEGVIKARPRISYVMLESMLRLVGWGYSDNEFCFFTWSGKMVKEYLRADARSPHFPGSGEESAWGGPVQLRKNKKRNPGFDKQAIAKAAAFRSESSFHLELEKRSHRIRQVSQNRKSAKQRRRRSAYSFKQVERKRATGSSLPLLCPAHLDSYFPFDLTTKKP